MCETNIYCDESCHLTNDSMRCMVLGALWCSTSSASQLNSEIAAIKTRHNLSRYFEIKWTKVSNGKLEFYLELLDYFFNNDSLGFRAWIIPDKSILRHDDFNQTHDDWYYKMYFYLLRNLIDTKYSYNIYLDIKDTRSRQKLQKLDEVIRNAHYDFSRETIKRTQHVHSHDINLMQLADLLIGALSYYHRQLTGSNAKLAIIRRIKERSGFSLNASTLPTEKKFNLCLWRPKDRNF